ncbi:hypothetical protein WA026_002721 [Henosepilachna vigintioctopunctata]|uniref:Adenosine 5'-monophosphoramidase HINT3 n=1 Tax=Henosepilachna vigintioctopunctata TaxID=420089 RepID=A0AAW1U159_9CUCU
MSAENCIFCKIISGTEPAQVCYQDDEFLAFRDIKPVAKIHFLVIPKQHFVSVNSLNADNISLVERMKECGKNIINELGGDITDIRLGFHCPPFNSIKHLHLHCISPTKDMSFLHNLMFRPNSWWFSTVDQTLENLKSKI